MDGAIPGRSAPGGAAAARQRIIGRLRDQWEGVTRVPLPEVHFLDSEAGIQAIHALRATISPSSASTLPPTASQPDFSAFQAPYVASNLGAVSQSLLHSLRSLQPSAERSAEHVAAQAREYVRRVLAEASAESIKVRSEAEELRALAAHSASLIARTSTARSGNVRKELEKTREEVERVLRGFKVWGTGAERVGEEVAGVVGSRWGYTLAQQVRSSAFSMFERG